MKFAKPLYVFSLMFALAPIAVIGCSSGGGDEGAGGGGGSGGDTSGGAGKGGNAGGGSSASGGSGSGGSSASGGNGGSASGGSGGSASGGTAGSGSGGSGGKAAGGAGGSGGNVGGSGGTGGAGGNAEIPSFKKIYEMILVKAPSDTVQGCNAPNCHGAMNNMHKWNVGANAMAAYTSIKSQVTANNAAGSTLYKELTSQGGKPPAMPEGGNAKLTPAQVKMIADWINAGALNN